MKNQKKLLVASVVFSSSILIVTWLLLHWLLPNDADFGFNGLQGLLTLLGIVFGIALLCWAFIYLIIKIIWPLLSGMSLSEYWLRPDERTLALRYKAVVYLLPISFFWFIGVHSFCRPNNPVCTPGTGMDLMLWGYVVTLFIGAPIAFRLIGRNS